MKAYDNIVGTVRLRDSFKGRALKESVRCLEGRRLHFSVSWFQNPDDSYPGEYALSTPYGEHEAETEAALREAQIAWISSGDVEIEKPTEATP